MNMDDIAPRLKELYAEDKTIALAIRRKVSPAGVARRLAEIRRLYE